jgi:hypothetical protein
MKINDWIYEHPFMIVMFFSTIFMYFIIKADMRAIKHKKHQMDIQRKKNFKKLLNENKS